MTSVCLFFFVIGRVLTRLDYVVLAVCVVSPGLFSNEKEKEYITEIFNPRIPAAQRPVNGTIADY